MAINPRYQRIYEMVSQIPTGKVATYGQIARLLQMPNHARQIGYALFRLPRDTTVPWHRVINAKGEISTSPSRMGGDELQKLLLLNESVPFDAADRIDLRQYQWKTPEEES